jgi:hypothetical protein
VVTASAGADAPPVISTEDIRVIYLSERLRYSTDTSDLVPMSAVAYDVLREDLAKLPPRTLVFYGSGDNTVTMRESEALSCAKQMSLTLPEYFAECEARLGIVVKLGA